MQLEMDKKRSELTDLRFVIWYGINLRSQHMRHDEGFKLFVSVLSPEYVDTITMSASTFDKTLATLYDRVKKNMLNDLRLLREECLTVGYSGPFLDAQLDLTTATGEEYITFTVTYVRKVSSDVTQVSLTTRRAFPGSHTPDDIKGGIEAVSRFCCLVILVRSGGCMCVCVFVLFVASDS